MTATPERHTGSLENHAATTLLLAATTLVIRALLVNLTHKIIKYLFHDQRQEGKRIKKGEEIERETMLRAEVQRTVTAASLPKCLSRVHTSCTLILLFADDSKKALSHTLERRMP
jgi:hypothetical protein